MIVRKSEIKKLLSDLKVLVEGVEGIPNSKLEEHRDIFGAYGNNAKEYKQCIRQEFNDTKEIFQDVPSKDQKGLRRAKKWIESLINLNSDCLTYVNGMVFY